MLRPKLDGEQVETLGVEVEQHRLVRPARTSVPAQPWQNRVDCQGTAASTDLIRRNRPRTALG